MFTLYSVHIAWPLLDDDYWIKCVNRVPICIRSEMLKSVIYTICISVVLCWVPFLLFFLFISWYKNSKYMKWLTIIFDGKSHDVIAWNESINAEDKNKLNSNYRSSVRKIQILSVAVSVFCTKLTNFENLAMKNRFEFEFIVLLERNFNLIARKLRTNIRLSILFHLKVSAKTNRLNRVPFMWRTVNTWQSLALSQLWLF